MAVGSNPIVPAVCERQRAAAAPGFEARKSQPGTAERREAARPGPSSSGSNSERLAPLVFRRSQTVGSLTPIVLAVLRETSATGGPAERIGSGARRNRRRVVAQPSNNDTRHVLSSKIYNLTPLSENAIRMY